MKTLSPVDPRPRRVVELFHPPTRMPTFVPYARAGVHRLMRMHTQKAQKHHTNTRHETHESAPPLHLSLSTSRHPELIQTAFGRDGG